MKTPEEMAEKWSWERTKQISGGDNVWSMREVDLVKAAFLAGYQAAAPQWISVSERMPEVDGELVLVSDGTRRVTATYFHVGERFHFYHPHLTDITHWQPLLQPPKEDK